MVVLQGPSMSQPCPLPYGLLLQEDPAQLALSLWTSVQHQELHLSSNVTHWDTVPLQRVAGVEVVVPHIHCVAPSVPPPLTLHQWQVTLPPPQPHCPQPHTYLYVFSTCAGHITPDSPGAFLDMQRPWFMDEGHAVHYVPEDVVRMYFPDWMDSVKSTTTKKSVGGEHWAVSSAGGPQAGSSSAPHVHSWAITEDAGTSMFPWDTLLLERMNSISSTVSESVDLEGVLETLFQTPAAAASFSFPSPSPQLPLVEAFAGQSSEDVAPTGGSEDVAPTGGSEDVAPAEDSDFIMPTPSISEKPRVYDHILFDESGVLPLGYENRCFFSGEVLVKATHSFSEEEVRESVEEAAKALVQKLKNKYKKGKKGKKTSSGPAAGSSSGALLTSTSTAEAQEPDFEIEARTCTICHSKCWKYFCLPKCSVEHAYCLPCARQQYTGQYVFRCLLCTVRSPVAEDLKEYYKVAPIHRRRRELMQTDKTETCLVHNLPLTAFETNGKSLFCDDCVSSLPEDYEFHSSHKACALVLPAFLADSLTLEEFTGFLSSQKKLTEILLEDTLKEAQHLEEVILQKSEHLFKLISDARDITLSKSHSAFTSWATTLKSHLKRLDDAKEEASATLSAVQQGFARLPKQVNDTLPQKLNLPEELIQARDVDPEYPSLPAFLQMVENCSLDLARVKHLNTTIGPTSALETPEWVHKAREVPQVLLSVENATEQWSQMAMAAPSRGFMYGDGSYEVEEDYQNYDYDM